MVEQKEKQRNKEHKFPSRQLYSALVMKNIGVLRLLAGIKTERNFNRQVSSRFGACVNTCFKMSTCRYVNKNKFGKVSHSLRRISVPRKNEVQRNVYLESNRPQLHRLINLRYLYERVTSSVFMFYRHVYMHRV